MTQDEIIEMAGHRQVPQWVIKLVCDAVAKDRKRIADKNLPEIAKCNAYIKSLEDELAVIRSRGEA